MDRHARKILSETPVAVFFWISIVFVGCFATAWGADEAVEGTAPREDSGRPGAVQTREEKDAQGRGTRKLKDKAQVMIDAFEKETCRNRDMLRYHGKCMREDERDALFELEIRHVESLLNDAIALYRNATPEDVGWVFHQAEQFLDKFEPDEIMDERIEEKLLLLLGFTYKPADRIAKQMKLEMADPAAAAGTLALLEQYSRTQGFLDQVHIPLMKLLGNRMDAYAVRHGTQKLEKLLVNNGLGEIFGEAREQ